MLLAGLRRDRRELTNSHCALQGELAEVLPAITISSSPEGGGFCDLIGDLTEDLLLTIATSSCSSSEDE